MEPPVAGQRWPRKPPRRLSARRGISPACRQAIASPWLACGSQGPGCLPPTITRVSAVPPPFPASRETFMPFLNTQEKRPLPGISAGDRPLRAPRATRASAPVPCRKKTGQPPLSEPAPQNVPRHGTASLQPGTLYIAQNLRKSNASSDFFQRDLCCLQHSAPAGTGSQPAALRRPAVRGGHGVGVPGSDGWRPPAGRGGGP